MNDFRGSLDDPDLVQFYDYWASLRRGRKMPSRKDIDPLQMPSGYLPNLMLIEVLNNPRRYRYRLVGTTVVNASGEDRTGQYFNEFDFFKIHPVVMQQYDDAVDMARPLYSLEPFTNLRNGSNYEVDRLLLPLSDDGESVDMLLVFFQFKTGPYASRSVRTRYLKPQSSSTTASSAKR